ncbi:MAG TPA: pyridoxamine 5'-phosphate oxidase family protein [Verrucomicrobiae bacterium]|jgi:general stress protein 26|nr:pyridoxamine 5'-phosphate oxidase family protein [Verrucomicrobiae bacterium]
MNRKEFLKKTVTGAAAGLMIPSFPELLEADMAEEKASAQLSRAELIAAAREIMASQQYCALITEDEGGRAQARTVNPFPPEEDMVVWFATSTLTRKVQQMKRDPRVTLYYANHAQATGYVAIMGKAVLVDDRAEMIKRKRGYWDTAFPEFKNLVLVKVVPEHMDVLNYARGAQGDPVTWHAPGVDFQKSE